MSSSSSIPKKRGRPKKDAGNVSLASTAAPTPGPSAAKKPRRPSSMNSRILDASFATTPSSGPKKRGRPPGSTNKNKLTSNASTISSLSGTQSRALDTSDMSNSARPPKGRLPSSTNKSMLTSGASTSSVVSRAHSRMLDTPSTSSSAKTRTKPPVGTNKERAKAPSILARAASATMPKAVPVSRYQPPTKARPPASLKTASAAASDSEVSLVDGVSDAESGSEDEDHSGGDASDLSEAGQESKRSKPSAKTQKKKGWPAERERMRRWRKLSVQERECISSEGGLVWRTAIPLLNSMPKNIRSMVADSLTHALNRIDSRLETGLVPPLARLPLGSATRRELPSSMLSWRLEEEGALLHAEAGSTTSLQLGMNAETSELEQMLLPEAEQIIELNKSLESQSRQLQRATAKISDLKKERRLAKSSDSADYPGNLKAHDLLSITAQKPQVDAALSSFLRLDEM